MRAWLIPFLFTPALALAQSDGAVSTAPSGGGAPSSSSDEVVQLPKMRPISPLRDRFDPNDGKPHGSVSATVGTGGVRAFSGHATVKPSDNVTVGIGGAYYQGPFYYPGYGPDYGYAPPPPAGGYLGETVEILSDTPAGPE